MSFREYLGIMLGLSGWITAFAVMLGSLFWLYPLVSRIRRRGKEPRPDGIQIISNPNNPKFEIVAVHGLGAHPEYTWIRNRRTHEAQTDEAGTSQKVHLLENLLKTSFPKARILSFAHNSDWLIDAPVKTAQQIGERLLEQLRLPIIFIGHSFGGIIIKQALCLPKDKVSKEKDHIVEDTSGILFLGTPHQGSSLSVAGSIVALLTSFFGSNTELLFFLRRHSTQLSDLESSFRESHLKAKIFSFCETKPSYALGCFSIGLVSLFSPVTNISNHFFKIVDRDSATGSAAKAIDMDTDHSGLNKCFGLEDPLYEKIKSKIADSIKPSLLDQADESIRESYKHKLKIERLSGEQLSMKECYINLAVVQTSQNNRPEDTVQPPTFRPSLLERFNIKDPDEDRHICLPALFEPRKIRGKHKEKIRRILIRGRPGVGKTTLCKKIVHDFIDAKCLQWNGIFKRLLWVPLRNLPGRQGRFGLKHLLCEEYFPQLPNSVSMLDELHSQCDKSDDSESLFLLDGLDEIWYNLRSNSDLREFVLYLLDRPNVIVTSRPSVQYLQGVKDFDIELETVGFYSTQVKQYVQSNQPDCAGSILDFLKDRPLIGDLVRIPILLDALCFTWKDVSHSKPETMTELYQAIERDLRGKDVHSLKDRGQNSNPSAKDTEDLMEQQAILLENLAFKGLHDGITVFDAKYLNELSSQLSLGGEFDLTLRKVSFLRSSDTSPKDKSRDCYFLHLTLQEYFAARHLARRWVKKEDLELLDPQSQEPEKLQPIDFFRRYKYSEKFDIVWRFLSGILRSNPDHQRSYFEAIQAQPLDMLGPAHQRLVMRCLFEIPSSRRFSLRTRLENQLSEWLLFEYNFPQRNLSRNQHRKPLAEEMEFPIDALVRLLRKDDYELRRYLLQSIRSRHTIHVNIVETLITWLESGSNSEVLEALSVFRYSSNISLSEKNLEVISRKLTDQDYHVQVAAVEALGTQSNLPEHLLQVVAQKLKDNNEYVRRAAVDSLGKQSNLPEHLLQAVAQRLDDEHEDRYVRLAAVYALGKQPNLPEMVFRAVVQKLGDKHQDIQMRTIEALGNRSKLPEHILQAITQKLEDQNEDVRDAAVRALKKQLDLSDNVLQEIAQKLEHEDQNVRWAATAALEERLDLSENVLRTVAQKLENQDKDVRKAAIWALKKQSNLSEHVLQAVTRKLKDKYYRIRQAAIWSLENQSNPPEYLLQEITQKFKDNNKYVRDAAIHSLRQQSNLPEYVLQEIVQKLRDKNWEVRSACVGVLGRQLNLPEHILQAVALKLKDKNDFVQRYALEVLEKQSNLPENILQTIAETLEDNNQNMQRAVIKFFKKQSNVPERSFQAIIQKLKDNDEDVQEAVMDFLEGRSNLPEHSFQAMIQKLKDNNEDVQEAVMDFLGGRSNLPEHLLQAVAQKLKDNSERIRRAAIYSLGQQSNLPEHLLQAVAQRLEDEYEDHLVKLAAVEVLGKQPNLPDPVLQSIATLMKQPRLSNPDDFANELLSIFRRHHKLVSISESNGHFEELFCFLLRQSFCRHIAWYHYDNKPHLIIDGIDIQYEGQNLNHAINEVRKLGLFPDGSLGVNKSVIDVAYENPVKDVEATGAYALDGAPYDEDQYGAGRREHNGTDGEEQRGLIEQGLAPMYVRRANV
ncbi:hypothetical protein F5X98DRAFT_391141 [Xylaria grammica]|nr:hypothetical protein F5X98DRAFT_391141 [Xylaria grammica]